MRKTKIVCTLGPATDSEEILEGLVDAGMNVARLNFSHGSHIIQQKRVELLQQVCKKKNAPVAILLDTKGPEIRIGNFEHDSVTLQAGQEFILSTEDIMGDNSKVSVSYKNLVNDVTVGRQILIDDGLVELSVKEIRKKEVLCQVLNGGTISNKKGMSIPDVELKIPFIGKQDKEDILFGIKQDLDYIAASFTRSRADIDELREILVQNGGEKIRIIAKIENKQGVSNIDDIIEASDGIMVARGDLGVEIPLEDVPVVQKMLISKCRQAGKQVITATQMLDSMIKNPRPTRAEVTDVANAIYQGTSAIMLSGETAAGNYPIEAVRTMAKIALRTEQDIDYNKLFNDRPREENPDITNAISHATCTTAMDLNAAAIITVTKTGTTARMIVKYRPGCPVIGCSTDEKIYRQMSLYWGVIPAMIKEEYSMDILFLRAMEVAESMEIVKKDDVVVLTAGIPLGCPGKTNLLKACHI